MLRTSNPESRIMERLMFHFFCLFVCSGHSSKVGGWKFMLLNTREKVALKISKKLQQNNQNTEATLEN